jgi:hypothetical protein
VGAVIAVLLIEPQPAEAEREPEADDRQVAVVSQHTPVCRTRGVLAGELQTN